MNDSDTATGEFELVVFDWDGTICDSLGHIVASLRYAIYRMEMPERADEQLRNIIGLGLLEAMERLFPGISASQRQQLAEHYREYYLGNNEHSTPVFDGAETAIRGLRDKGHTLAVATGKSRAGLDNAMRESGFEELFHFSRCADETFSKPHPQMLHEIMELADAAPGSTLMIGDSEHDLQMASNAGVRAAAVTYGAQPMEYLVKFNPVVCFHSLSELPGWLTES